MGNSDRGGGTERSGPCVLLTLAPKHPWVWPCSPLSTIWVSTLTPNIEPGSAAPSDFASRNLTWYLQVWALSLPELCLGNPFPAPHPLKKKIKLSHQLSREEDSGSKAGSTQEQKPPADTLGRVRKAHWLRFLWVRGVGRRLFLMSLTTGGANRPTGGSTQPLLSLSAITPGCQQVKAFNFRVCFIIIPPFPVPRRASGQCSVEEDELLSVLLDLDRSTRRSGRRGRGMHYLVTQGSGASARPAVPLHTLGRIGPGGREGIGGIGVRWVDEPRLLFFHQLPSKSWLCEAGWQSPADAIVESFAGWCEGTRRDRGLLPVGGGAPGAAMSRS